MSSVFLPFPCAGKEEYPFAVRLCVSPVGIADLKAETPVSAQPYPVPCRRFVACAFCSSVKVTVRSLVRMLTKFLGMA